MDSRECSALFFQPAVAGLRQLGHEYPEVLPNHRKHPTPVPAGYVQRIQSRQLLCAEYHPRPRSWDDWCDVEPEAHAGSSQALLVMRAQNLDEGCCLLFDLLCLAGIDVLARAGTI